MCGRFVQVISIEKLEQRFGVSLPQGEAIDQQVNIAPGDYAYVITQRGTAEIRKFRFGMMPSWANKPMYLFNARSEGDENKENKPDYEGIKGIFKKPAFKKPIRSQRCLVLANAFIEGSESKGLNDPYAIYLNNKEPFSMAGIWDVWEDKETGEEVNSFAIITTVANELLEKLPHHRCPVILDKNDEQKWLNTQLPLKEVLALLKPYPGKEMIAEPISVQIKNPKNKNRDLLIPLGDTLTSASEVRIVEDVKLKGMGTSKRKGDPPNWQGSLFDNK